MIVECSVRVVYNLVSKTAMSSSGVDDPLSCDGCSSPFPNFSFFFCPGSEITTKIQEAKTQDEGSKINEEAVVAKDEVSESEVAS